MRRNVFMSCLEPRALRVPKLGGRYVTTAELGVHALGVLISVSSNAQNQAINKCQTIYVNKIVAVMFYCRKFSSQRVLTYGTCCRSYLNNCCGSARTLVKRHLSAHLLHPAILPVQVVIVRTAVLMVSSIILIITTTTQAITLPTTNPL